MVDMEMIGSLRGGRRSFLKKAATAGAAAVVAPMIFSRGVMGANERINIAVAGFNGVGKRHIRSFDSIPGVSVVALCDVDRNVLDSQMQPFKDRNRKISGYTDIREVLDRDDIDAIAIATPNHWHTLMTVWACQTGKDVYVEKPLSHNLWEGRQAVKAARKYRRIVQHGTQSRSAAGLFNAFKYIQEGNLGAVKLARGLCYKRRESIGKADAALKVPDSIDYDLWCGPAEKGPLMRRRFHYDWHWVWPTGNGDIGNQGVHEMDMCLWALGEQTLPRRVISFGGRLGYKDDGETPNTQIAFFDYRKAPIIFEVRGLPRSAEDNAMDAYRGVRVGLVVHCEDGYFAGGGAGGWVYDNSGKRIRQFTGDGRADHQKNFIDAMRSRKTEDLKADVLQGHLSSALCHLANISYRVGEKRPSHLISNRLQLENWLSESFGRMATHLSANEINLLQTPLIAGHWLDFDPDKERFIDHDEANSLLARKYREPFVVPDITDPHM